MNPKKVLGLILTGSSGLYEKSMGKSYPKRGDYEYIKKGVQDVFYDPELLHLPRVQLDIIWQTTCQI
jgi:hypothetical protein